MLWHSLLQTLLTLLSWSPADCLSWKDREALLLAEIASLAVADVIVLQEVDRLEAIAAALPEHTFLEGRGPGKQHGCVIFWRTSAFEKVDTFPLMLQCQKADRSLSSDLGSGGPAGRGVVPGRQDWRHPPN